MTTTYNYKAIAFFCATGFFPDSETYILGEKYSYPSNSLFKGKFEAFSKFHWHYEPQNISLDSATDKFAVLLEKIIDRETGNRKAILPLSGGLDSRTLATALKRTGKNIESYSYRFRNGHDENKYGSEIARICKFPFHSLEIEEGYLWKVIDELALLNHCYSEFTNPRQMAFINQYPQMGDFFALGHWGDVLFDDMHVADALGIDEVVEVILKKITKKGGVELASGLWVEWNLEGTFAEYFYEKIKSLLVTVHIPASANATIRAFKSKYWATRWTASNFCVFESAKPVSVPYFDTEMCQFVCTLPESLLSGRQIQISYLKRYAPELAKVTWQAQRPFNLYTYSNNKSPFNLPYRIIDKIRRLTNTKLGKPLIQRNWELQFAGNSNKQLLKKQLFENETSRQLIPIDFANGIFNNFYEKDTVKYSHPLSILLTISLYLKHFSK